MASESDTADITGVPDVETNPVTVPGLRPCELVRVDGDGVEIERGEVIATWPYTQNDLKGEEHTDDVYTRRVPQNVDSENGDQSERVHHKFNGRRATIATPDGSRYAVVDWARTDDPAIAYMLIVDSDTPEDRQWMKLGHVDSIQRYGPQPQYKMGGMSWHYNRDAHVAALENVLNNELETDYGYRLSDRHDELHELKSIRDSDTPQPLSKHQILTLATVLEANRDHVLNTNTPLVSDSVEDDANRFHWRPAITRYTAMFPDGNGGWITSERNESGIPSEDIPPWEQEQNADPDFQPLTAGGGSGGN